MVVNQNHDSWSLPKGHIDEGEDKLTAAKREIFEASLQLLLKEYNFDLGAVYVTKPNKLIIQKYDKVKFFIHIDFQIIYLIH